MPHVAIDDITQPQSPGGIILNGDKIFVIGALDNWIFLIDDFCHHRGALNLSADFRGGIENANKRRLAIWISQQPKGIIKAKILLSKILISNFFRNTDVLVSSHLD